MADGLRQRYLERKKQEMYEAHFGNDGTFFLGDVHTIPVSRIPTAALATASFPCNDLSLAGARAGLAGEQSSAFWGFIRVLRELRNRKPSMVLLENVVGFLTSHRGNDFRDALLALKLDSGVNAVDAFIVDAAHFLLQSRVRLFVAGVIGETTAKVAESPGIFESEHRPPSLADFIYWHPEIAWEIRELSGLPQLRCSLWDIVEDLPQNSAFW